MDNIKTIKWVLIDSIKLWIDNPRKNDAGVSRLRKLLDVHGFKSPLIVWDKNKVIYKGNTTWKAAKLGKYLKVPVIFVSFKSITAAIAYGISDNRSSEYSEWDDDLLQNLMSNSTLIQDPESLGFEPNEIEHLLKEKYESKGNNSNQGILDSIKIICKPHDKENIIKYLKYNLIKRYKGLVIK